MRSTTAWADVTLLTWDPGVDLAHADAVRDVVQRLVLAPIVPAPMRFGHRAQRWAQALAGDLPPWIQALRAERRYPNAVAEIDLKGPFDVIVAEDDAAAFLLPPVEGPVVVHRHNVFSRTLDDLRRGPARLLWPFESAVWRRFDAGSRFAALHVVPTEECGRALQDAARRARVEVVPNGVDVPREHVSCREGRDVALIGTMDYAPNAQGAEWFIRHVWPRVRDEHADTELLVIGRGAVERLAHLEAPGVRLIGFAPDLRRACASVRAGAVPLQAGLGIKTKTLDLMAMGIPVVATPTGAEGIAGGPIVVRAAREFADALCSLLDDPAHAERIGLAGRTTVTEDFSWAAAAATYRFMLEDVVRSRSVVGP